MRRVPILAEPDVLIIGGTASGVAFALACRACGLSVFLAAPRAYLGEDICGAYRFWPARDGASPGMLFRDLFPDAAHPPTPMHVKLTLEQALVNSDIPFLFNVYPAGVLKTASGSVRGAVVASRAGRQAIPARLVVDASMEGRLLRLNGCETLHGLRGIQKICHTTLCHGAGADASGVPAPCSLPGYSLGDARLTARRYTVDLDCEDGSPVALARAYSEIKQRCRVPDEFRSQTLLTAYKEPAACDAFPCVEELLLAPGLLALTEAVALSSGRESCFRCPSTSMAAAEVLARQAVKIIASGDSSPLRVACHGAEPLSSGHIFALQNEAFNDAKSGTAVDFDPDCVPVLASVDVVVVGGGTGGAPAAIAAGRAGARTLVLEAASALGGVGTVGQIASYWFGNRVGFTHEIDQGVAALETRDEFKKGAGTWSVSAKSAWYHQTGLEAGCMYWFNTLCIGTWKEGHTVRGILVAGPFGYGLVKAGCVVDSTGCSDVPAAAGAPTKVIGKEHVAVQGTGLAGVQPGREQNNSDHDFSDDTDIFDTTAFMVRSKLKFRHEFDCGELVDSRERRQIVGETTVQAVDILYHRTYPDTICVATSNFDTHGFTIDPAFMLVPPTKHDQLWADIPLRALLPKYLDGVLVTGLGISAHRDALPVIRMQADVQNQGYAAGYIAARSALSGHPLREISVRDIQRHLVDIGSLPERVLNDEDRFPVALDVLDAAIQNQWDQLEGVALILDDAERSLPLLQRAYAPIQGQRSPKSLRYAQLLALLDDRSGAMELETEVEQRAWDAGWNYTGMGQFGMSISPLDSLIVCLGLCGEPSAWECLLAKVQTLPDDPEFSHCRALASAFESLYARSPDPRAGTALYALITRSGMTGHSRGSVQEAQVDANANMIETQSRNHALREIHLARALYCCGDPGGLGKTILERYASDIRGHFKRHAQALLTR